MDWGEWARRLKGGPLVARNMDFQPAVGAYAMQGFPENIPSSCFARICFDKVKFRVIV